MPHRSWSPTLLLPAGRGTLFLADKRNMRELLLLILRGIKKKKLHHIHIHHILKVMTCYSLGGAHSHRLHGWAAPASPQDTAAFPQHSQSPGAEVGWAHTSSPGCNVTAQVNYQQRCRV